MLFIPRKCLSPHLVPSLLSWLPAPAQPLHLFWNSLWFLQAKTCLSLVPHNNAIILSQLLPQWIRYIFKSDPPTHTHTQDLELLIHLCFPWALNMSGHEVPNRCSLIAGFPLPALETPAKADESYLRRQWHNTWGSIQRTSNLLFKQQRLLYLSVAILVPLRVFVYFSLYQLTFKLLP